MTPKFSELTSADQWENTLKEVCNHIANGGSTIDLCKLWGIRWSDLDWWLNDELDRKKKYLESIHAQSEWAVQRILTELRALAFSDVRKIFNDDHSLKQVKDWPEEVARMIGGVEVDEIFDGYGDTRKQVGYTKKVKLVDKIRALELMMKNLNMLTERNMHAVGSLDDQAFRDEFFGIKK